MKNSFRKYITICILLIVISEITKLLLNYDKLIYNSLSEQLTSEQVSHFFALQKKWQWIGYIFLPVLVLLKTLIIATILFIGLFFFNIKLKFNAIWNVVLNAEFIFLLVPVFKIIWFYFFKTTYTLEDVQYFLPLSAINIINYNDLETWFIYPFQVLNFFELAYVIYLGYQIGKLTNTNTDNGLKIVGFSYVPALLLWVSTVMFFSLNNS